MMRIFKALVFAAVYFFGGNKCNYDVTGFQLIASTKSTAMTIRLLQREKNYNARQPLAFRMSTGDESTDNNNNSDTTAEQLNFEERALKQEDTSSSSSINQGDIVDVVTTSFPSDGGADLSQQDEEINPNVSAGLIVAGLVFSFVLLYFELQQAQLLNY
mmetsp:Transcript_10165/g.11631  ORF Transcript_10165/g.11631 Transcript_10165/m.11631 type:complete len:159 (+) Transcript_10165:85-561(+)